MWNSKTVSIVLPAFNEEKYIRPAVNDFFASGIVDEVIVVDNNSRDRTAEEAGAAFRESGAKRLLLTHRPAERPLENGYEQVYDGFELDL